MLRVKIEWDVPDSVVQSIVDLFGKLDYEIVNREKLIHAVLKDWVKISFDCHTFTEEVRTDLVELDTVSDYVKRGLVKYVGINPQFDAHDRAFLERFLAFLRCIRKSDKAMEKRS